MSGFSGATSAGAPINNLTSTSTTQPLAAAQGKVLNDKISNIKVNNETTISASSVSSGSWKTMATITGLIGRYIFIVNMAYGTATEGIRVLMVDTTEGTTNDAANSVLASGRAVLQKVRAYTLNGTETIYIRAYQNSGSAVSCGGSYGVVQLQ